MLTREEKQELRASIFCHLDGIVTAPSAYLLHTRGVTTHILEQGLVDVTQLAQSFQANEGYLNVALRVLSSQGWLEQNLDNEHNRVSYSVNDLTREAFDQFGLYSRVVELMKYSARFHARRFEVEPFRLMENIATEHLTSRQYAEETSDAHDAVRAQISRHIDGVLLGPTIVHLGMSGMFHKYFMEASFRPEEFHEDGSSFGRLLSIFADYGWFRENNGTFQFTEIGLFYARRASAYGVTVSYIPTLRNLDELMFGDPATIRQLDSNGNERHVDREMNVWGSGGAHAAYFKAIDEIIIDMFNRPISQQPRGILDMGCGNGAFLIHLYDVIEKQTIRGEMLEDHPLFLVGVDFNEAALKVTKSNLSQADIWAKVIWGDIGRPDKLAADLRDDYGIDLRDLLNVRTFLDHNRIWKEPSGEFSQNVSASTGAYASMGKRLANAAVEASLREHLEKWAPFVDRFGLLVIELHTIPPALTAKNLGRTAATAYDATHGYSDQFILEVDVFRKVAEEAGLKGVPKYFRKYPNDDLATVTINLLNKS